MRITDANAANRIANWAIRNADTIPAAVRNDIAVLAESAVKRLLAGPSADEIARLRKGDNR
ncbi:hypothetical protein G4X40_20280 [Rhodococcus sp. D2-41]|uniref:hypothetical protein n=1 Tax=Speluncibacter jeojiensis TaxID=2710754 RepID=UPI00240FE707|nr:hypothetical protein [Rhodococcus sp. D2-41]MDG3012481.1 hypothetical protein [Rhodococcus sp. D2-41]